MAEKNNAENDKRAEAPPDVEAEVVQDPALPSEAADDAVGDLEMDASPDVDPTIDAGESEEPVSAEGDDAPKPKGGGKVMLAGAFLLVLIIAGGVAWRFTPLGGGGGETAPQDDFLSLPAPIAESTDIEPVLSEPPLAENLDTDDVVELDPFSIEAGGEAGEEASGVDAEIDIAAGSEQPVASDETTVATVSNSRDELAAVKESFLRETQSLKEALASEQARSQKLAQEIDALKKAMNEQFSAEPSVSASEIDALRERISKIENNAPTTREAASSLAFARLKEAASGSAPFVEAWSDVARLASGAPAVGALAPLAENGAPTVPMLIESFNAVSRTGLAVAGEEMAETAGEKLIARAQSLVSVRPADAQEGAAPRAVMSRAEAYLNSGDVSAALQELESLPPGAQDAMADWTAEAEDRAAIDAAIAELAPLFAVEETQ